MAWNRMINLPTQLGERYMVTVSRPDGFSPAVAGTPPRAVMTGTVGHDESYTLPYKVDGNAKAKDEPWILGPTFVPGVPGRPVELFVQAPTGTQQTHDTPIIQDNKHGGPNTGTVEINTGDFLYTGDIKITGKFALEKKPKVPHKGDPVEDEKYKVKKRKS